MSDLLTRMESPYLAIYDALQQVRETFHREGRISDSNAKLDETVKFLAIHFGHLRGLVGDRVFASFRDRHAFNVDTLNSVFAHLAQTTTFCRQGMGSIFGPAPSTVFEPGDENIAFELFNAAGRAFEAQASDQNELDVLNEAYGHFVRDNFRNHVEDAQYMTPPEVVRFMVNLALRLIPRPRNKPSESLLLVDPSCGVGSFLTAWRSAYTTAYGIDAASSLKCIGQDKVDRMVRLTAINLIFSDSTNDDVFMGNTIQDGSPLSESDGQVDLILTNPPFGARFTIEELQHSSRYSTPFVAQKLSARRIVDSEILFIDRYLTLLKPGGLCFAIVPDGVVSAKGMPAILRQHLARNAELISVVELPAVTFAQAGTRTKTAVLAFRKKNRPRNTYSIFFSEVLDLGFQVSKRKGVPIKKNKGVNQLTEVLEFFLKSSTRSLEINSRTTAGWRDLDPSAQESWTPRTMLFDRESLERRAGCGLVNLKELTEIPLKRKVIRYNENTYFISVLHVIGEGILDIPGIKSYKPVTAGIPVEPGEVILSRINPRIPRVAVVPDLGRMLLCSSEYEILRPKPGLSPYLLVFLLLTSFAQEQIQSLTAGTSASHSRIKPRKIYEIALPCQLVAECSQIPSVLTKYEEACKRITAALIEIEQVRQALRV